MASRLNPYLSFQDNARTVMELHRSAPCGEVRVPLEMQVRGDELGLLTDRFGVGRLVDIAGETAS